MGARFSLHHWVPAVFPTDAIKRSTWRVCSEEKTALESRFAEKKNDLLVAQPQTQMIHVLPQATSPSQAAAISVNFQHVENSLPNGDGFEWRNNNQEISRKITNQILMTNVTVKTPGIIGSSTTSSQIRGFVELVDQLIRVHGIEPSFS
jgi:hypothetical protein